LSPPSTLRCPTAAFRHRIAQVLAVAADDVHDTPANVLLAPGRDIPTTVTEGRWGFVTGSSFAAAHVTGLVALMRELAPSSERA
jgi:subtilisin family serine protease